MSQLRWPVDAKAALDNFGLSIAISSHGQAKPQLQY